MAELRFTALAQRALLRLVEFLAGHELGEPDEAIELILSALEVLRAHPYIGRPVRHGLRELVISRGRSGYVALYEFVEGRDEVRVLALRHQRELDYQPY